MQQQSLPEQAKPFLLEGGVHGVLMIHGFTATPALVRPLAEALHAGSAKQGDPYTVQGILLPGHGTRIEDMRAQGGYKQWLRAAREGYDALAARCQDVAVVGHSMGGVLALLLAEEKPVHAVISIAAPMRLQNRFARIAPLVGWALPILEGEAKPRGEGYLQDYDIGYAGTPLSRVGDLLRLMRQAERGLPALRCPLLIAQSKDDETVQARSVDILFQQAGSRRKEVLWLERSGHICTIGPERETLFAACTDFLARV